MRGSILTILAAALVLSSCELSIRRGPSETFQILPVPSTPTPTPTPTPGPTPTVSITSPAASAYINLANVASFAVSGNCSENGQSVQVTGAATGSATCTGGSWSLNLDFSAAAQGSASITVNHSNASAVAATPDSRAWTKDTIAPAVSALSPNSGSFRGGASQSFSWNVTDTNLGATPVVLSWSTDGFSTSTTFASGLDFDGPYNATIPSIDSTTWRVRATATDLAGNSASDTTPNMTVDSTAPSSPALSIASGATYTTVNPVTVNPSATGAAEMYVTNTAGCASGGVWESYATSKSNWTLAQTNATATVYVKFRDAVGNESTCESDTIIHDDIAPSLAAVTVANGSTTDTNPFYLVYGTITDTYNRYCILENDTNINNCTFTTAALPSSYMVTAVNGAKVLSVWIRDAAGNTSTRTDTASVTYNGVLAIAPTSFTATNTRGQTNIIGGRQQMGYIQTSGGDIFVAGGRIGTVTPISDALFIRNTTHLWEGVAPMHTARIAPEVVELADGRFVVLGGCTNGTDSATNTVEIFNPATGRWARLANMATARCRHTATLLADGRILVAGGRNGGTFHSSTEIFNVNANFWSAGPAMASARHYHRAIRVANNRVLIIGGGSDATTELATMDVFDPSNNTISAGGVMNTARMDFGAIYHTAAEDGNFESVHVIGGWDGAAALTATEILDVNNGVGVWTTRAALATARRGNQFVKLASGGALAVTGWTGAANLSGVEQYNRVANTWTARTNNNRVQSRGVAAALGDGRVILMGGSDSIFADNSPVVREFNVGSNAWTAGFDLLRSLINMGSTKLNDGSVLTCGGLDQNDGNVDQDECYRYYPSNHSLRAIGKMQAAKEGVRLATLSNGMGVITGGLSGGASSRHNLLELFDPATNTLSLGTNLPRYLSNHILMPLPGSKLLIAGGYGGTFSNSGSFLNLSWEYDYGTNSYTAVGNLPGNRARACYTKTPSGRIFAAGGYENNGSDVWYNTLSEYDTGTQTWVAKATMAEAGREWCSLVAYESGGNEYLIVAGGSRNLFVTVLNTAERYDVTNNTWSSLANMNSVTTIHYAHINAAAGRMWIFGGYGGVYDRVQEYNIVGNTWTNQTVLSAQRFNLFTSSVSLDDGRVLLIHGNADAGRPAEVYHFATPQALTASGGDKNYSFTVTGGGQGTMHSGARVYVPPFPLPGGTSTVRVTDGLSATADSTATH